MLPRFSSWEFSSSEAYINALYKNLYLVWDIEQAHAGVHKLLAIKVLDLNSPSSCIFFLFSEESSVSECSVTEQNLVLNWSVFVKSLVLLYGVTQESFHLGMFPRTVLSRNVLQQWRVSI